MLAQTHTTHTLTKLHQLYPNPLILLTLGVCAVPLRAPGKSHPPCWLWRSAKVEPPPISADGPDPCFSALDLLCLGASDVCEGAESVESVGGGA